MLFKKKTAEAKIDYSFLHTDMHSHLLPALDDGSPDFDVSVELIKQLKELGFKKFITTPHVMWDMYKNSREIILERMAQLRKRLEEEQVKIEIEAAAEYFIDDYFESLLKEKHPLLSFGNKLVLVEFSMASAPFDLKKALFEMQIQGYQPVIAHPERYVYAEANKRFFDELKESGCFFQLNALSLSGHYGRSVTKLAHFLLKNKFYNLIGTDLHHFKHLDALKTSSVFSSLKKVTEISPVLNPTL